jgi:hypothetical protein
MSNNEQGFRGVPGLPDGFELVEFRRAFIGDFVFDNDGFVHRVSRDTDRVLPIVRKIEKPKRYRQFENGEEFKPFRDRWWRYKSEKFTSRPPRGYDDCGWICGDTWGRLFDAIVFDDGSPFGVEVTE